MLIYFSVVNRKGKKLYSMLKKKKKFVSGRVQRCSSTAFSLLRTELGIPQLSLEAASDL